jgi:glucokinase
MSRQSRSDSSADKHPYKNAEATRAAVVAALKHQGPMTVADLVKQLEVGGLTRGKDAIREALARLKDAGLVLRSEESHEVFGQPRWPRSGRRPAIYSLSAAWSYVIGVEISATVIRAGLADANGVSVSGQSAQADHTLREASQRETLEIAAAMVESLFELPSLRGTRVQARDVAVVTLALPGPVNDVEDAVGQIDGWSQPKASFAELLPEPLRKKVRLDNDANVRAIGEAHYGKAKDKRMALVLKISSGVGMGIVADGAVVSGAHGAAGEYGHVRIDPNTILADIARGPSDLTHGVDVTTTRQLHRYSSAERCVCGGSGHLQSYVSMLALTRRLFGPAVRDREYRPRFAEIEANWRNSDAMRMALDDLCWILASSLADLTRLLDPDAVVITGRIARLGNEVAQQLSRYLRVHLPDRPRGPSVGWGSDKDWIGVRGAARAAIHSCDLPLREALT